VTLPLWIQVIRPVGCAISGDGGILTTVTKTVTRNRGAMTNFRVAFFLSKSPLQYALFPLLQGSEICTVINPALGLS